MSHKQLTLEKTAIKTGLDFVSCIKSMPFIEKGVRPLSYSLCKKYGAIPVSCDEKGYTVAITDAYDLSALDAIRLLLGGDVAFILSSEKSISDAIDHCYAQKDEKALSYFQEIDADTPLLSHMHYDLLAANEDSDVIRLLNIILLEAVTENASDIHFEPSLLGMHVRYRVDGVLATRHTPPLRLIDELVTRIKVIAKLDIAEKRLPQDGRIQVSKGDNGIDFRVSTTPTAHGERVVLRVLDKKNQHFGLEYIGMSDTMRSLFAQCLRASQGIILVTGPTGSGKSTTLYSALFEKANDNINIMTIEDPVEYEMQGVAQIGVNPKVGLTFASGLRSILRQDPDVIMVGEIRDAETAQIAVQASLTGHFVLTTLHTNDAPSSIARLEDMGIETYLLSSSIIAVVAQRLVRLLCECKEMTKPSQKECDALGILYEDAEAVCVPKGCALCHGTGYKGRTGIYEILVAGDEMRNLLVSGEFQEKSQTIMKSTLRDDAREKVLLGITSVEEVIRVVGL